MREPLRWLIYPGVSDHPDRIVGVAKRAALGPWDDCEPPSWLWEHQRSAFHRLLGAIRVFGGALLADAVGLGKTHVALALAEQHRSPTIVLPHHLVRQWKSSARQVGVPTEVVTHEALSRGRTFTSSDLVVIDEAHRFKNSGTRRYRSLSRSVAGASVLLVTATPVVNRARDLVSLLRIFLPDNALAFLGVPSLERLALSGDLVRLCHAITPLSVARSPATVGDFSGSLPDCSSATDECPPSVAPERLGPVIEALDELEFLDAEASSARQLLKLHLLYRLYSSAAALRQSLNRYRHYLRRARDAAARGERLNRAHFRKLYAPEDAAQFELALYTGTPSAAIPPEMFDREERQAARVLELLPRPEVSPKVQRLKRILEERRGRKTLVFTTASATALAIAEALGWHRLALVTAAGARIASGKLSVGEALTWFAPRSQRLSVRATRATELDVLVATDLISEGLDLQDADAVIHYDLPWTPLRLEQRLGRVLRLGSPHRSVKVWWFVPPAELEQQLELRERISTKAQTQFALGVPQSSVVGKPRILGSALEWRERIGQVSPSSTPRSVSGSARHTVVDGEDFTLAVLCWRIGNRTVPELLLLRGTPVKAVYSFRSIYQSLEEASKAESMAADCPRAPLGFLESLVRERLLSVTRRVSGDVSRDLARRTMKAALAEGRTRNKSFIPLLDRLLSRISEGLTAGAESELEEVLDGGAQREAIRDWLERWPAWEQYPVSVTLEVALFSTIRKTLLTG